MKLNLKARLKRALLPLRHGAWALLRLVQPILQVRDIVLVTRHADACEVLANHSEFSVRRYRSRMRSAGADFFLGHDDDTLYRELQPHAKAALLAADPGRVREIVQRATRDVIAKCGGDAGEIDVVRDISDEIPIRLIEEWFGLPNPGGRRLLEWGQLVSWSIFNPFANEADVERARSAGRHLMLHIERHVKKPVPDSVLGELVKILAEKNVPAYEEKAGATLAGLVLGTLGPGPQVFVHGVDRLLGLRGRRWRELGDAARREDFATLETYLLEAGRLSPAPPVLARACERETKIRGHAVEPGKTVLCVIESALRDRRKLGGSCGFRPERWREAAERRDPSLDPMMFGHGLHWCFGRDVGMDMLLGMAQPLFVLPKLRRAPGGQLLSGRKGRFPEQNHPRSLRVRFSRDAES